MPRRQGWIRTIVTGFADPYLTTRPHDYKCFLDKYSNYIKDY